MKRLSRFAIILCSLSAFAALAAPPPPSYERIREIRAVLDYIEQNISLGWDTKVTTISRRGEEYLVTFSSGCSYSAKVELLPSPTDPAGQLRTTFKLIGCMP